MFYRYYDRLQFSDYKQTLSWLFSPDGPDILAA